MSTLDEVKRLWDEGKTSKDIQEHLGIPNKHIRTFFDLLGISRTATMRRSAQRRALIYKENDEDIYADWLTGMSYADIESKYKVSDDTIQRVLRQKGVTTEQKKAMRKLHGRKPKRNRCCACGILIKYCEGLREIQCKSCPWANWEYPHPDGHNCCSHRKEKGMMCSDCQAHLMLSPSRAGNDSDSQQKGG